jgi:membrane protease YdiL (CAAX protease family)
MENETPQSSLPNAPDPLQYQQTPGKNIFLNERGLRAGWRILIYLLMVIVFAFGVNSAISRVFPANRGSSPAPGQMLLIETLLFLAVFVPACVMAVIERRSVGVYGLPAREFLATRFWQGVCLGVVEIAALVGCIAAFGGYSFGPLDLHGAAILKWGAFWAVFFSVVGLFEEFTFRGYLQFTLADGIGFWPAAWILSLGFGAVHLGNKGESPVGALGVAVIGIIFALALKRTGNLWFLVGWHASFDFGETFLFSVPNSGGVFEGHLSNATLHGPVWLTGGSVGPEGSIFSFVTMGLAALFIHKVFPAKPALSAAPRQSKKPIEGAQ